jgi:hypothetical protein
MMYRCYNEKAVNYRFYGGRGIRVCEEWHDIKNFKGWVENSGRTEGTTIDRIDVDADYSPANCRWRTARQQANNRRNTLYLTAYGQKRSVGEWAELRGLNRQTIVTRIRRGWSIERALEENVHA